MDFCNRIKTISPKQRVALLARTSSADMREGPGEWRSRRYGVIVAA